MNLDSIVDLIVEEVYKKINMSPKDDKNKKLAVILGDYNFDKYSGMLDNDYKVVKYDESIKECDLVIIPYLCIKGMANLANMTMTSKSEYFIVKMLMSGKKVYVLEEGLQYRKYKHTAPKALYNKYLEFEDSLIKYGIEIIQSPISLENKLLSVTPEKYEPITELIEVNKPSLEIKNKKLISESDIRRAYMNGVRVVIVDKGSIITPLARDFVKINNISIINK